MDKIYENCCICLKIGNDLRRIVEIDDSNQSAVYKLRLCVPEIEWKECYVICTQCVADANLVHQFREKCLNSERVRRQPPPPIQDAQLKAQKVQNKPSKAPSTKPYSCRICGKKFGSSSNLGEHLKYHEGNRNHVCTYCGKSFISQSDLKIHEKIHLNKREYKCEECSRSYNTHKDLRTHKFVVHTDPSLWKHVCKVCEKRFPIKSNYDVHMRRHTDERPFACHLCDKKFIEKYTLQKHFKSHSNFRAYACEVCKKEYKDKRGADLHKAKIHGIGNIKVPVREKRHFCHVCPKSYFEKNKLTRHLYTHTGESLISVRFVRKDSSPSRT